MSALPDPTEIERALPEHYRAQFRADYASAIEAARRPEDYHRLVETLHLWRLRAAAYGSPGYVDRLGMAHSDQGSVPAAELIDGSCESADPRPR